MNLKEMPADLPEQEFESPVEPTTPSRPHPVQDAALALSLANLCFIEAWFAMLFDSDFGYFNKTRVTASTLWALTFAICASAFVVWLIAVWVRRSQSRVLEMTTNIGLCLLILIPMDFVRSNYSSFTGPEALALAQSPLVKIGLLAGVIALLLWHRLVARAAAGLVLILFPLSFFTFGKIALLLAGAQTLTQHSPASIPRPPAMSAGVQPHIVWIIFDEIDQRIAFSERPGGLQLPELDRIRGDSFYATNAFPPGGATYLSLPALFTGLPITEAVPSSPSELSLTLASTNTVVGWSKLPTIFSRARALGVNTALVGWYHPYDRLFGASLNYCSWYAYPMYEPSRAATFQATLLNSFWSTLTPLQRRRLHLKVYQQTLDDSLHVVTNSHFGLILLHLPVPHQPGIYLPATREFSITSFGTAQGYLNNLVLADRTLGELRHAMETAGIWQQTWLLVSSDHWWRASAAYDGKIDHRVPFILKAPGAAHPATYSQAFNTAITHDLLLAILQHQLERPEQIVTWLDRHRTAPPSRYPNTRKGR